MEEKYKELEDKNGFEKAGLMNWWVEHWCLQNMESRFESVEVEEKFREYGVYKTLVMWKMLFMWHCN